MAHFIADQNNGVTALITPEDADRLRNKKKLKYGIFLFASEDVLDWPVQGQPWFHGSRAMMKTLLEGHTMEYDQSQFYGVPFSNGAQHYADRETLLAEVTQIAPMHKLLEAFRVDLKSRISVS